MIKKQFIVLLFLCIVFSLKAQETKKGIQNIKKVGVIYNYVNEKNILFDDKDYPYATDIYKLQAFYDLGNWRTWKVELIVQPQIQTIKHQLLNR